MDPAPRNLCGHSHDRVRHAQVRARVWPAQGGRVLEPELPPSIRLCSRSKKSRREMPSGWEWGAAAYVTPATAGQVCARRQPRYFTPRSSSHAWSSRMPCYSTTSTTNLLRPSLFARLIDSLKGKTGTNRFRKARDADRNRRRRCQPLVKRAEFYFNCPSGVLCEGLRSQFVCIGKYCNRLITAFAVCIAVVTPHNIP